MGEEYLKWAPGTMAGAKRLKTTGGGGGETSGQPYSVASGQPES